MIQCRNNRLWWPSALFATLLIFALPGRSIANQEKLVAGYVENLQIHPGGLELRAKIDSGAKHSSLNAKGAKKFTQDGNPWVRFSVRNKAGQTIVIESPIHRTARIRRHANRVQTRDVIMLGICLGTVFKEVEVNLINRSGFNYQMLVGRSFLKKSFLIDPGKTFLLKSECEIPSDYSASQ